MNRFKYSKKIFGVIAILLVICATVFTKIAIADAASAPTDCSFVGQVTIIPDPNDPNEIDITPPT
ncbi:MAG: hypothetical protein ACRAVC_24775, partial [Trichormus sp.]